MIDIRMIDIGSMSRQAAALQRARTSCVNLIIGGYHKRWRNGLCPPTAAKSRAMLWERAAGREPLPRGYFFSLPETTGSHVPSSLQRSAVGPGRTFTALQVL